MIGTHDLGGGRRWYVLALLTLVYAFNIADRYVISTLIEPIKESLRLSDSAVGFLTGTALAIVYTGMGFPLALIADRSNRRNLLAASITLWSLMTASCGLAGSFLPLLIARIGVGVGEAGATPGSQSMIGDLFGFNERLFANAVFAVGAAVGSMLGGAVGGAIGEAFGWRAAFLGLAVPSLLLAPLVLFTVTEPPRGHADARAVRRSGTTVRELISFARGQHSLLHTLAGVTVCTFWSWGLLWWTPAYLARSHGMTTGEAGVLLGVINGVGGTVGVLLGGFGLQAIGRKDPRRQCWALAAIVVAATVASIAVYVVHSRVVLILMLCTFVPVAYVYLSPAFGWIQSLVPPHMRASFCAAHLFGANIANLAIAPSLVGFFSDRLKPEFGAESLRYVLTAMAFSGFWAAYHFWAVARRFSRDLERAGTDISDSFVGEAKTSAT